MQELLASKLTDTGLKSITVVLKIRGKKYSKMKPDDFSWTRQRTSSRSKPTPQSPDGQETKL